MAKIIFEYSPALDEMLTGMSLSEFQPRQLLEMAEYKSIVEKRWKKLEKKVFKLIEKSSSLKFRCDNISCYVVKTMEFKALSSPLIIRKENQSKFTEIILIHELIHILLTENKEKIANYINVSYPEKTHEFRIHIPVLMIQKKVMESILPKENIKRFMEKDEDNLKEEWLEASKHIHKYKGNIVEFLKNEDME